ncbi:hypothetical protein C8255_22570 [filamentous cyanobacterium CCP3]|nr:hypothetical protein C8255_22570 [filamentous cyanobacterium CCP3]
MFAKTFRNTLIASTLVVAGAALAAPAMAQTAGSVTLGGTVAATLNLTTSALPAASSLDLTGGEKILQVADLNIHTNNEQGYTLTATQGSLTKTGGTAIPFQVVVVGDGATAPLAAAFTVASGTNYTTTTSAANAAGAGNRDLYMRYTPAALQDPGAYAGTISLTVADN